MISFSFQGKPFNITVIQVYAPTSNAEEAEVEPFYEDLQDLLELTTKKDVFCIPVPYNEKDIFFFFFSVSSRRSYRSSLTHSTSASSALLVRA